MVSINLYQPRKLDITLNFPSAWNDLSPEEVTLVAKVLLEQTEGKENETRPRLLIDLIESAVRKEKKPLPKNWQLFANPEEFVNALPLLDFIFEKNDRTDPLKPITIRGRKYYPVPFKKITCGEYEDGEVLAQQFTETPSHELLASLAAILFRPSPLSLRRGAGGEALVPYMQFNHRTNIYRLYQAEKKQKHFLKLLPEELYAIFIWYAGNRNQLPEMFEHVYNGPKGEPDMMAFTKCIHSGAGPKNGTREHIRASKLLEFMFEMDQEAEKAAELEAEYERMKNQP